MSGVCKRVLQSTRNCPQDDQSNSTTVGYRPLIIDKSNVNRGTLTFSVFNNLATSSFKYALGVACTALSDMNPTHHPSMSEPGYLGRRHGYLHPGSTPARRST